MPDNVCICCGRLIPEGRQICRHCEEDDSKGTNREWLRKQSEYDLLCDLNANFINGTPHCILEVIESSPLICPDDSCNHCIAAWLNRKRET